MYVRMEPDMKVWFGIIPDGRDSNLIPPKWGSDAAVCQLALICTE